MDGDELQDRVQPTSTGAPENPRVATYFFAYLGALVLDAVVLNTALLFSRHSVAYEWMNRVGIFVAVLIVLGLFVWIEWGSGKAEDLRSRPGLRWYLRALGLLLPILATIKLWNRVLQAFWLR